MKLRRLKALIIKETLQIIRDPSSILIAFILPIILLFIFGYGVNLDNNRVKLGLVIEADNHPDVINLIGAFSDSRFFDLTIAKHRQEIEEKITNGQLRGMVIIPQNFNLKDTLDNQSRTVQIIADGSEPNIASFVQNYAKGALQNRIFAQIEDEDTAPSEFLINSDLRFWYNSELKSRDFLIPGSIAIIMTLIGTLLTSLVIAREWERGTMEALMSTPVSIFEILIGKIIPYFILGMGSMALCTIVAVFLYDVPLRAPIIILLITSSAFLLVALSQGLLISTLSRNQFVASQFSLMSAFLPAFMLSGFIFEINSMPLPIRALSHIVTARYFVTALQTIFLAGNIVSLLVLNIFFMLLIGAIFLTIILLKTHKRLE